MRRAALVLGLVALFVLALGVSALADGVLPGSKGPYDLRALVHGSPSQVTLMWSTDVSNGHPPYTSNTVTYTVYKFQRGDGREFKAIASCEVDLANKAVISGPCGKDQFYGYITFNDSNVQDYEEYSYLVTDDPSANPNADAWTNPADSLMAYVVVRAFPPTQTRHGNYSEYTNACTACHGLHSSKHKKLLKGPTVTDLCGTCHDGTGSKYDEVRGKVRLGNTWNDAAYAAAGPFGDRLKANSGVVTTSVHNVMRAADPSQDTNGGNNIEPNSARVWQAPGSGWATHDLNGGDSLQNTTPPYDYAYVSNDWESWLVCSSCHEPHDRGKNYRILRPVINDRTNISVRGVAEIDPSKRDASSDRGNWEGRAMYTKFLAGGNSVLVYYDPQFEDPRGEVAIVNEQGGTGGTPLNPPVTSISNPPTQQEQVYLQNACTAEAQLKGSGVGKLYLDSTSPTGVRCEYDSRMGGVVTFCTACHRTFMWPDDPSAKTTYSYKYGSGSIYGYDRSYATNSGSGPMGLSGSAKLEASFGQHKHPMALPAHDAMDDGRLVDGVLNRWGDICITEQGNAGDCNGVKPIQSRVKDPILPLEGTATAADASGTDLSNTYQGNRVMCLSCHVPHGSGSERVEVAYQNDGLNDTSGATRDPITGYLWNRAVDNTGINYGSGEIQRASGSAVNPRWETQPAYLPPDTNNYTIYGFSSVLARFNPMASACYRCHSTTPGGNY